MVTVIEGVRQTVHLLHRPLHPDQRCRPLAEILAEVRHLLAYGFAEIELLGQTVNHWRDPERGLDCLPTRWPGCQGRAPPLRDLLPPWTFRPAWSTARPSPEHLSLLHLPVQSGSDTVLRRMGRGYEVAAYLDLVRETARRGRIALSTDFIVGFPGETEEEFARTLELVAGSASPPSSPSATRLARVRPRCVSAPGRQGEAEERLQRLLRLRDGSSGELNEERVGAVEEVVVTGWGERPAG